MKRKLFYITGYALIAVITYGYSFHERVERNRKLYPNINPSLFVSCEAGMNAAFWPIYIPCHISRKLWTGNETL